MSTAAAVKTEGRKAQMTDEDRKSAAQAKRDRKNAKRARDAELQRYADLKAREAMEMGIPRGLWFAGVYAKIELPE